MSNHEVHKSHCCILHGCKYGDSDCPVENGLIEQEYVCEYCYESDIKTVSEVKAIFHKKESWDKDRKTILSKLTVYEKWLIGYRKESEF